jgi:hypothetical protein
MFSEGIKSTSSIKTQAAFTIKTRKQRNFRVDDTVSEIFSRKSEKSSKFLCQRGWLAEILLGIAPAMQQKRWNQEYFELFKKLCCNAM